MRGGEKKEEQRERKGKITEGVLGITDIGDLFVLSPCRYDRSRCPTPPLTNDRLSD